MTSRFEPCRSSSRLAALLVAGLALPAAGAETVEQPPPIEKVFAVEPEAGSVLRSRPVFVIGFDATAETEDVDPRRLRFRITLEEVDALDEEPRTLTFDQRRRRSGWLVAGEDRMLFRPRRPVPDGRYRWRPWAWNGIEWIPGGAARELRIDTVPPEGVANLRITVLEEPRMVKLAWDPVVLDRVGAPEFVRRYHVYRYVERGTFPVLPPLEIGTTTIPTFVDREPPPDEQRFVYYRVTAEDEAGNEAGRRD